MARAGDYLVLRAPTEILPERTTLVNWSSMMQRVSGWLAEVGVGLPSSCGGAVWKSGVVVYLRRTCHWLTRRRTMVDEGNMHFTSTLSSREKEGEPHHDQV
jgi:hypothetical protein